MTSFFESLRAVAFGVFCAAAVALPVLMVNATTPSAPPYPVVEVHLQDSQGSAVHIGDGLYITASHVVGKAGEVTLVDRDGNSVDAKVLWAANDHDVALIRAGSDLDVPAAALNCNPLHAGEEVRALGSTIGARFQETKGTVSGEISSFGIFASLMPMDITVYSGMSGGAVLDSHGRLVGIINSILSVGTYTGRPAPIGFSFAVPGNVICMLLGRDNADIPKAETSTDKD